MDTTVAFAIGMRNRSNPMMVFDWDKAAEIIRDHKAASAAAGLAGDWDATGGAIYGDGKPIAEEDTYVFLASTWAEPQLDVDGETMDCFIMQEEAAQRWGDVDFSKIYWPASALAILKQKVIDIRAVHDRLDAGESEE